MAQYLRVRRVWLCLPRAPRKGDSRFLALWLSIAGLDINQPFPPSLSPLSHHPRSNNSLIVVVGPTLPTGITSTSSLDCVGCCHHQSQLTDLQDDIDQRHHVEARGHQAHQGQTGFVLLLRERQRSLQVRQFARLGPVYPQRSSLGQIYRRLEPNHDAHDKKFRLSHIFSGHSLPGSRRSTSRSGSLDEPRPSAVRKAQKVEEKERKAIEQEKVKQRIAMARQQSDLRAAQVETPEQRARYGEQYPEEWNKQHDKWADIFSICDDAEIGDTVTLRARIHTIRDVSSHLVFIVLRQQISTIQAVLAEESDVITGHMVRWAKRLPLESIVMVRGKLQKPREPITGATTQQAEIKVHELFLVAPPKETLPFNVYDADLVLKKSDDTDAGSANGHGTDSDGEDLHHRDENHSIERHEEPVITQRVRLTNRIIDLRTPTAQAIFRINAAICNAFRTHLDKNKFIEIHTPKLQGGASESGSSVFMLDYFGRLPVWRRVRSCSSRCASPPT